jgi:hypothetical protein
MTTQISMRYLNNTICLTNGTQSLEFVIDPTSVYKNSLERFVDDFINERPTSIYFRLEDGDVYIKITQYGYIEFYYNRDGILGTQHVSFPLNESVFESLYQLCSVSI